MVFIITGLFTILTVFLLNKLAVTPFTNERIVFLIPLVEEITKTGFALFFGTSILINHVFFGTIEALDDLWRRNKKGIAPAIISFIGHLFFGIITITGMAYFSHYLGGIIPAFMIHVLWNFTVIKMVVLTDK